MKKLTQGRLKELLYYNPKTGVFVRLKTVSSNAKKGQIAGSISKSNGYRYIWIDNKRYLASRLAWFYMEGYWPENEIDDKDRVRLNNKWENLRHATRLCNVRNSKIRVTNKSGITGVYLFKRTQRWVAQIHIIGKSIHLGCFTKKRAAAKARWEAEIKYGFPRCQTTSSAYLYLQNQ